MTTTAPARPDMDLGFALGLAEPHITRGQVEHALTAWQEQRAMAANRLRRLASSDPVAVAVAPSSAI